jgi:hypothetical protein
MVSAEIGVGYRTDTMFNGMVESTQWPVTGSLWFSPMPVVLRGWRARAGTTPRFTTRTRRCTRAARPQEFGMHVGGGLLGADDPRRGIAGPATAAMSYLGDQTSEMPPSQFNASFWTTSLGLALHF